MAPFQKNRDLETNLILKTVLSEISRDEDKEIALFAAESLNALEKEYNNRLMKLKEKIGKANKPQDRAAAAEVYYNLALLNNDESTLSNFYLKEAYLMLGGLENEDLATEDNRLLLIRILIHLKLYDQAQEILPDHKDSRLIKLEIAFQKKEMNQVRLILENIRNDANQSEEEQEILAFWSSTHE